MATAVIQDGWSQHFSFIFLIECYWSDTDRWLRDNIDDVVDWGAMLLHLDFQNIVTRTVILLECLILAHAVCFLDQSIVVLAHIVMLINIYPLVNWLHSTHISWELLQNGYFHPEIPLLLDQICIEDDGNVDSGWCIHLQMVVCWFVECLIQQEGMSNTINFRIVDEAQVDVVEDVEKVFQSYDEWSI